MAEVLTRFTHVVVDHEGVRYHAHACAAPTSHGTWEGWLEFLPVDGGAPVRSARETTQPNRTDAAYWATGLTAVYLDGALKRALNPPVVTRTIAEAPAFDGPAPGTNVVSTLPAGREAVLDPFAVYARGGEALLRRQLSALASWHLVNIVEGYELSGGSDAVLNGLPKAELIETIVSAVARALGGDSRPGADLNG
jgi:hypothetical protein